MKILEEFWYGSILPTDRDMVPNSKMDKLLKLIVQSEERLIKLLSEEERTAFQKFKDSQNELSSVNECESFVLDFRLGAAGMGPSRCGRDHAQLAAALCTQGAEKITEYLSLSEKGKLYYPVMEAMRGQGTKHRHGRQAQSEFSK